MDNAGVFVVQEVGALLTSLSQIELATHQDTTVFTPGGSSHTSAGGVYVAAGVTMTSLTSSPLRLNVNGAILADIVAAVLPTGASTLAEQQSQTTLLGLTRIRQPLLLSITRRMRHSPFKVRNCLQPLDRRLKRRHWL